MFTTSMQAGKKSKLLGLVMCGGQSTRMGHDKGSMIREGKAWAVCVAEKLKTQGLKIVVSVNTAQVARYQSIFPHDPLITDQVDTGGPLQGLLSVHAAYPDQDLLLMACDMIDMDEATLSRLIEAYKQEDEYDFYVYRHQGFSEPFCAIYTAKALSKVKQLYERGELKKFSLHERFENGSTHYLEIPDLSGFKNFNYPL